MAYQEVKNGIIEKFTGEGAIKKVEGIYRDTETKHGEFKNKPTIAHIHTFDNNGEVVRVWGKGQLDYKMKGIPVGTWVRVTYLEFDGTYHQFKVEIDDERSEGKAVSEEIEADMAVSEETEEDMV